MDVHSFACLSRLSIMDSRDVRIASALLLQVALAVATATASSSSAGLGCDQTCRGRAPNIRIPYPFGFSPGCPVQLNCSTNGTVLIGEFPVRNITPDFVTVGIPATCNRPFQTISPLFGLNFSPTLENAALLTNCTWPSPCQLPSTLTEGQFPSSCDLGSGILSCYSGVENRSEFLNYDKLSKMKCRTFVSSILVQGFPTNQPAVFGIQTIQLEWWVNGDECRCSRHANCTRVSPLPGGGNGYRCICNAGFGDNSSDGPGCWNNAHRTTIRVPLPAIAAIISVASWMVLFACICCCIRRSCHLRQQNNSPHEVVNAITGFQGLGFPRRYKFCDLKKITRSFSEKLGEGGYGEVYKGKLQEDGRLVAVKILKESKSDCDQFINEVASIRRTAHVNIVELLGFCYEGKKRALLYDYMPNGSLDKFLPKSTDQGSPNCPLEWKVLHRIAIGIARGLEYLHQGCNTRILHFDIKPQNILLDHDFTPKISDFGLAKLCQGKESIVSMLGMRGTIGFIAPEVFSRNFGGVSHKSDVYSYGMLVFEVIGGKDRTGLEASRSSEMYFPEWVYRHLESGKALWMSEINSPEDEEIARNMMLVSLWCIQTNPIDRPSMSKVVEMLGGSTQSLTVPPKALLSSPPRQALNDGTTKMSSGKPSSTESISLL